MNVFVKPSVLIPPNTWRESKNASDGRHAAIRGLVTTCYAFVKESFCKLETHGQFFAELSANGQRKFSPKPSFAPGPRAQA